jgi:hypothetical protein
MINLNTFDSYLKRAKEFKDSHILITEECFGFNSGFPRCLVDPLDDGLERGGMNLPYGEYLVLPDIDLSDTPQKFDGIDATDNILLIEEVEELEEENSENSGDIELEQKLTNHSRVAYLFLNAYIELIAKLVDDRNKWVDWYVNVNDFGRNGLKAFKGERDVKGVKIKNSKDLWELINLGR